MNESVTVVMPLLNRDDVDVMNESATVEMPLLNRDDLDVVNEEDYVNVVNEEEGTSSL